MGSISKLVPKFELNEAESIAPSVKMKIFPTDFDTKSVKNGQNGVHFKTGTKIQIERSWVHCTWCQNKKFSDPFCYNIIEIAQIWSKWPSRNWPNRLIGIGATFSPPGGDLVAPLEFIDWKQLLSINCFHIRYRLKLTADFQINIWLNRPIMQINFSDHSAPLSSSFFINLQLIGFGDFFGAVTAVTEA